MPKGFQPELSSESFPVVSRLAAPLRQQVLENLRRAIINGRLAPGTRLVERELIEKLGVSRTVVREVLRQLESEGLIAVVPNRGAEVRALSLSDAQDLYSIRGVLEGLAARLFAMKAGQDEIGELERALERTIEAYRSQDPEEILEVKNKFYEVLFKGASSETLSSMLNAVHARIWRWRALGLAHPRRSRKRSDESIASLRSLVASIKKREKIAREEVDKAAAEVMSIIERDLTSSIETHRQRA
jgi:GntR family transcriptional regulator, trigonelline degradation regulator